ncbi:MAG: hypothetical protein HKN04_10865, partial [Rhodothermaceae bacterium]|nr:hypothetical protein [Rhodothermaceae bacterium]
TVHVQPKPMDVLVHLAAHAGQTVSRDELMEAVWPDVYVTEHALNRCVSQLRKLFGDDPRDPQVIETIPKAGYRLIAPVEWLPGDSAAAPLDALDLRVSSSSVPMAGPMREERPVLAALVLAVVIGIATMAAVALSANPGSRASATRPLTVVPGTEGQAAWSPEGTRVVYVHGGEEGAEGLYVRALGVDTPRRLTDGPSDNSPTWLPDGETIAFIRCGSTQCDVFAVSASGGAVWRLADGPARGLSVSPDGRLLAFAASDSTTPLLGVMLLDRESGARQRLTTPPSGFVDGWPRFSPDGAWVAFTRRSRAGADLYRVPVPGGPPQKLTDDHRPMAGHTWAADGRSLLFSSARTGVYALWRLPASGGVPERVVGPAVRDPGSPVVAPGGERLAVEDWVFEINLWESAEDGAEPVRRASSVLWDKQPHLSADGQRLAFVSNRSGFTEVWTAARDGSNLRRLTGFDGASVEHPRFSPDGQYIVFQVRTEVQADLYLIEANGVPLRRLTTDEADDVAPRWSRDGRFVYFGSNRSGSWQIWRKPVEGGPAVRITTAGGYTAEEAPDGTLLLTRYAEPGLWRMAEGAVQQLSAWPALGDWGTWAVTEQGVLIVERNEEGVQVLAIDPVAGTATPRAHAVSNLVDNEPSLTATADGAAVITARVDRVEADLLLVEPFE